MAKRKQSVQSSPIDDLTYDIVTVLHQKAKGLEAYDKYLEDASDDDELTSTLEEIRENDQRSIENLQRHLFRLMRENGRFSQSEDWEQEEEETPKKKRSRRAA
jgi:hypothetical protein